MREAGDPVKRNLILILVLCLLLAGCGASDAEMPPETAAVMATEPQPQTEAATLPPETEPQPRKFLLTFAGDCTLGCRQSHSFIDLGFTKVVGEDYGYPFRNVVSWFEEDDLTIVNLEGALCDSGNPVQKTHTFRGPTAYVNILTENSVEMVSLANNHAMDYGQKGYDSTAAALEDAGVPYVERDKSCLYTTESGLTIGIYGAVYYKLEEEAITSAISRLKEEADLVIFAPHWGVEKTYTPTAQQKTLAYAAIDAGADIVYGSHTHTLQPVERYHGGIIYYSLGNFSFGGNIYPADYDSALIRQEVLLDGAGELSLGETVCIPVCISSQGEPNDYQPTPYPQDSEEYARVMEKLSGTWKK